MYLTASRPDIMFAVYVCARFQVTLKTSHLLAVKRIFRYLKGKPTLGLWYSRDSPFELVAYIDSDYAGSTQDRKSTTGGCQFLGNRLISWQCKKQTVVATSTTEAEYVGCCSWVIRMEWGCTTVLAKSRAKAVKKQPSMKLKDRRARGSKMRQSMRKVFLDYKSQRMLSKEIAALKKRIQTGDVLNVDTGVLEDDEMSVEAKVVRKGEQSTKPDDSTAGEAVTKPDDSTAGKAVTTANVESSVVPPILRNHWLRSRSYRLKQLSLKLLLLLLQQQQLQDQRLEGQIALDEQIAEIFKLITEKGIMIALKFFKEKAQNCFAEQIERYTSKLDAKLLEEQSSKETEEKNIGID
ncbi:hypothetical protein Tco_0650577 [Tanacetum coccineum]